MQEKIKKPTDREVEELRNAIVKAVQGIDPRVLAAIVGFDPTVAAVDVTVCGSKCFGAPVDITPGEK